MGLLKPSSSGVIVSQSFFSYLLYSRMMRSAEVDILELHVEEVSMSWCWHVQHGTGSADGRRGIKPETDSGNGREAIN